jgi:hypothetical protein
MRHHKQIRIANLAINCAYCQPKSGCILSDLKGKKKQEIFSSLEVLTNEGLDRIISFHECCAFRHNIQI